MCDQRHTKFRYRNNFKSAIIPDVEPSSTASQAPRTTLTKADRELGYKLGAVMLRCMSADGGTAIRVIDESGLSFIQMKLLMTLAGTLDEAPTLKPIAEKLGLSLPSASRAVDVLVNRELVARTEDPDDRRQRRLALTDSGQQLAERIMAARMEGLGQFAASLSESEREHLDEALSLLLEREEIADIYEQYRRQAHL
jgi:DNA-binding MarR family transcriptional regulator